jgi:hypothetical protein
MSSYLNLAFGLNPRLGPAGLPAHTRPAWQRRLVPWLSGSQACTHVVKPNLIRQASLTR